MQRINVLIQNLDGTNEYNMISCSSSETIISILNNIHVSVKGMSVYLNGRKQTDLEKSFLDLKTPNPVFLSVRYGEFK